jgi:mono/diheme cytochrome c family protein
VRYVFAILALALSASAAEKKPLPWEKGRLASGQALYRANCVVCHDVDIPQSATKKVGPSFYQLFRQPAMPLSGQKPTREAIRTQIKGGGVLMPAFDKSISDSEIDKLLDYMQSK